MAVNDSPLAPASSAPDEVEPLVPPRRERLRIEAGGGGAPLRRGDLGAGAAPAAEARGEPTGDLAGCGVLMTESTLPIL